MVRCVNKKCFGERGLSDQLSGRQYVDVLLRSYSLIHSCCCGSVYVPGL